MESTVHILLMSTHAAQAPAHLKDYLDIRCLLGAHCENSDTFSIPSASSDLF